MLDTAPEKGRVDEVKSKEDLGAGTGEEKKV
jgi:hypothetical protein